MINHVKNIKDPEVMDKLIKFAKVMENDKIYDLKRSNLDCLANVRSCEVTLNQGRKYTKVDYGDNYSKCGMFMIDNITGEIFGIKGYGKINKKHYYGTLNNFESKFWGNYNIGVNKNYTRDMQNLLTISEVVKEMEKAEQKQNEQVKPITEQKINNSNCVIKFVNDKIIVQFNDSILNQDQEKLQLLAHNGFTYDFDNKIFVADNNDFMKNLLIKLGFLEGELTSVRKTRKEPFQIKETMSNQNVEENNSKNKQIEYKNSNTNDKNVIFVDFKQAKKKNVAPEETIEIFDDHFLTTNKAKVNNPNDTKLVIEFINEQNEVSSCNDWKTATKIYNKLITFTMLSEKELNLKVSIKKYGEVIKQTITINKNIDFAYNFKNILIKNITKKKKELFNSSKLNASDILEKNNFFEHEYNLLSCF